LSSLLGEGAFPTVWEASPSIEKEVRVGDG